MGTPGKVAQGTVVIREGEPISEIYILLDGEFRVTRGQQNVEIARLGSGEMIGEMSFIDASPPSANVVATVDSFLLEVPRDLLERRLQTDSGMDG